MKKAGCEKQDSVTLRSVITGIIEHARNDVVAQYRNGDVSLNKRVHRLDKVKYLSVCLSMCQSVFLFLCQSVFLSVWVLRGS